MKYKIGMNQEKPFADYIGYDLGGFLFNKKYPPNPTLNCSKHYGYATDNQEAFFYDVALYLYGIKFTYDGRHYWIPSDGNGWVLINEDDNTRSDSYENPLELIENAILEVSDLLRLSMMSRMLSCSDLQYLKSQRDKQIDITYLAGYKSFK